MTLSKTLARAIAVSLAGCGAAHAFQLDYTLSVAIGHSDNLNESATNPVSESTRSR